MKLVIEIDEEVYKYIMKLQLRNMAEEYIAEGTPLPKGHWVDNPTIHDLCNCSECGALSKVYSNYCPNCGCRMIEQKESEEV